MGTPALVFDFGGPVLLTPFELAVISPPGTAAHDLLAGRGPLADPAYPDPDWTALQAGKLTEREYWDHRAVEWAEGGGGEPTIQALIAVLYDPPRHEMIRPGAWRLMDEARAAGRLVGVLTNDLRSFHSDAWVDQMHILEHVDVIVDGSVEGVLKPDPRLYAAMADRLGVAYADWVFIDDQRSNVVGAEELGIPTVHFDVTDPEASYDAARVLLGLPVAPSG